MSRAAVRRRRGESERDEDPAGREPAQTGDCAAAAQPAGEGVGEQGVGGVRAERDQHEQAAEERDLQPRGAAARVDELRQEGEEEEGGLRIEDVDDDALGEDLLQRRGRRLRAVGLLVAA